MFLAIILGFSTGLILQIAVGPIFFYIIHTAIQGGAISALSAIAGVTIADYFYIFLALIATERILNFIKGNEFARFLSPLIMILFGAYIAISSEMNPSGSYGRINPFPLPAFFSGFILTLSSPITCIFWSSVFTEKARSHQFSRAQLIPFGLAAGSATFVFLGSVSALVTFFRADLSGNLIFFLNLLAGIVILIYGVSRLSKQIKNGV